MFFFLPINVTHISLLSYYYYCHIVICFLILIIMNTTIFYNKRNLYLHFALLSSTQQLYWMLCFWSKWAILWNWLEQLVKRSNGNHWKAGKYLTKGINLSVTIHFVHRTWTVPKISSDLILCFLFFKLIFWMGCIFIFCWVQFECKACFYICCWCNH